MFRFTLFNAITLFILAITLAAAGARFRARFQSRWFAAYYLVVLAYAKAFAYSLNAYWILVGVACAVVLRFGPRNAGVQLPARALESAVFVYVVVRSAGLITGWPW